MLAFARQLKTLGKIYSFPGLCQSIRRNSRRNCETRTKQMFIRIVEVVEVIKNWLSLSSIAI